MVRVENVKIDGNIVTCDYYPENKQDKSTVKFDLNTEKIIEINRCPSDDWGAYVRHAINGTIERIKENDVPPVFCVAWY